MYTISQRKPCHASKMKISEFSLDNYIFKMLIQYNNIATIPPLKISHDYADVNQVIQRYLCRTTLPINTLVLVSSCVHQFPQCPEGSPMTTANVRMKIFGSGDRGKKVR